MLESTDCGEGEARSRPRADIFLFFACSDSSDVGSPFFALNNVRSDCDESVSGILFSLVSRVVCFRCRRNFNSRALSLRCLSPPFPVDDVIVVVVSVFGSGRRDATIVAGGMATLVMFKT